MSRTDRPDGLDTYPANPYRVLLRKYIDHVGEVEGTTFAGDKDRMRSARYGVTFTDEEWAEVQRLADGGE